jgi:lipopolysaccharide export system protein LptA
MSLGFDAISALPFAASGNEGNVIINVTGNALTLSVGQPTATGEAANVIIAGDPLTLASGLVTLTADANVNITASPLTLNSALVTASGAGNISISGMPLTLKASSVTITGEANIDVTDNQLTISSNESGVITWNPIIPGANNVWTEIEPY